MSRPPKAVRRDLALHQRRKLRMVKRGAVTGGLSVGGSFVTTYNRSSLRPDRWELLLCSHDACSGHRLITSWPRDGAAGLWHCSRRKEHQGVWVSVERDRYHQRQLDTLLRLLECGMWLTTRELAHDLDVSTGTAMQRLMTLQLAGVVTSQRRGQPREWALAEVAA